MKNTPKSSHLLLILLALAMMLSALAACATEDENNEVESKEKESNSQNADAESLDMSVMTFNIRVLTTKDTDAKSWDSRKQAVGDFILNQGVDILCMQEVSSTQNQDLKDALWEKYNIIWYGRDGAKGEGLAIAYDRSEWKLIDKGRFWLSETPDVMSYGWDATTYRRICVTAVLEHQATGARIGVYNVHLDNESATARTNGIKLVLERIADCEHPVYLCGDFNTTKSSDVYALSSAVMTDGQTAPTTEIGHSYNGWGTRNDPEKNLIDFTFFTKDAFEPVSYGICTDKWGNSNENFLSDHYAVKVTVKLLSLPKTDPENP